MAHRQQRKRSDARAFLTRFARDARANTIAIMAMALIPLAGIVGSGVDISRMYIVKTRLQHACDAGALAGRKAMGAGTWAFSDYAARTEAQNFFDANFPVNAYGATNVERSFSESNGKVTGTASAVVPMTLMRIFGRTTETMQVACDAEMKLPNTDVMFVLDVTGSMAGSRISGLKSSVKCFYEILSRRDTLENCPGGNQSGGVGNVQVRFGFVPYATNVNIGKLLPTDYIADKWSYQSREPEWNESTSSRWDAQPDTVGPSGDDEGEWSTPETISTTIYAFSGCPPTPDTPPIGPVQTSYDTPVTQNGNTRFWDTRTVNGTTETEYSTIRHGPWNALCSLQKRTRASGPYTSVRHTEVLTTTTTRTSFRRWHYGKIEHDVSGLKNGSSWRNSVNLPIGPQGTDLSVTWDGCIEERATTITSNASTVPTNAKDLDIDLVPTPGDPGSYWGPALRRAIYMRENNSGNWTLDDRYIEGDYPTNPSYNCPTEGRKLAEWNNAGAFENYVNSLSTGGATYHDIGLLWGARFLSPTGIFKAENAETPSGGSIVRHLIFMTDGESNANNDDYAAYGLPWYDRRQNGESNGAPNKNQMDTRLNTRFGAICTKIKNMNITLWVIAYGDEAGTEGTPVRNRLEACASTGRFRHASDSAALQQTFSAIAGEISQLRLTR